MKTTVKFYTLGCKTNQYETQAIREIFTSTGSFREVNSDDRADVYVVNTCTVTAKADKDCRWIIRRCHRENPMAKIVVTGCLAEADGDMISGLPGVSFITKNNEKDRILEILERRDIGRRDRDPKHYTPLKINDFHDRSKAFVKIQDGCDNFCSYCKIPFVRGNSRSRDLGDILEEINRLLDNGFKEIVLSGICLGDWGKDLNEGLSLKDLIERLESIDRDFRVRLSSIEPKMVTDELIARIARSKKVCPHLHIPLQSGSNRILRLMERPYSAKDYKNLIKKIKQAISNVSITTDVMVGFPGETIRDFKETERLIRSIMPSRLHIFSYSERKGTKASRYKGLISKGVVKMRRTILEALAEESSYRYRRRFLNRRVEGLIENRRDSKTGLLMGYTETYIRFLFDGPDRVKNSIVPLKIANVDLKSTFCNHL